jgi:hypothetical protein
VADLVPDRTHGLDALAGRIRQLPVARYWVPGNTGQASPQPIVMTTSLASTACDVSRVGTSAWMSIPTSAIACTATALILGADSLPGDWTSSASPPNARANPADI